MIKIDLITGFLGSGKTTFMKRYANYLIGQGMKIGILENDYGAVNIDMMLLQDLEGKHCTLEMVSGGCDADCHKRRFKTKLIAMGMSGYDRVLVEPSGIFDMDEFFDTLYEEPLSAWYEIGNVIAIVNADLEEELSNQSEFLLASQIANAGKVILSRTQDVTGDVIAKTIRHMNRALERFGCKRRFHEVTFDTRQKIMIENDVVGKPWLEFTKEDFSMISQCGYCQESYRKEYKEKGGYMSLYFMNGAFTPNRIEKIANQLFTDFVCGDIFRIKGFTQGENGWLEINATHNGVMIKPTDKGQAVIIVIGEHLNRSKIEDIFGMKANEL